MTFQPVIGLGGLAGWRVLQATQDRQRAAFEQSPAITRDLDYFRQNAGAVNSAEELVADRRLLSVALGAYGLSEELEKQAFVRQVLEGGTENDRSFANRLADPRYEQLAVAFDFGNSGGVAGLKGGEFAQALVDRYDRVASSPLPASERAYVEDALERAASADQVVRDDRVLAVVQTAFSLDAQFDRPAFAQRILADGTATADALANQLDARVDGVPFTLFTNFFNGFNRADFVLDSQAISDDIIARYNIANDDDLSDVQRISLRLAVENASSAEELLQDERVLDIALSAFGLESALNFGTFLTQVAAEGIDAPTALANQLDNSGYVEFAAFFNFGDQGGGGGLKSETFREAIVSRYQELEFERAVGEVNEDFRLAMNFEREIDEIAASPSAGDNGWLRILGQPPLRELVSTALGLPDEAAQIDIDQQVRILEERALDLFGDRSPAVFQEPENIDLMIRRFFVFRQIEAGPSAQTPGVAALTVLGGGSLPGASGANLLLSQA